MSGLLRLQHEFAAAVRAGGGTIEAHLSARSALPPGRGVAIYANAHRLRLTDALRDVFGHTAQWRGAERFARVAAGFIAENGPPESLRRAGDRFPRWLAERLADSPMASELASLDHALRAAFDGPDATVLTPARLAEQLEVGDVPIAFVPTLRRLRLRLNTLALWHALDSGEPVPRPRRLPRPLAVAVWRVDWRPHFRSLPPWETRAVRWVGAGTTLEALCARQAVRDPDRDAASHVGALLRRWIGDSMLRG